MNAFRKQYNIAPITFLSLSLSASLTLKTSQKQSCSICNNTLSLSLFVSLYELLFENCPKTLHYEFLSFCGFQVLQSSVLCIWQQTNNGVEW